MDGWMEEWRNGGRTYRQTNGRTDGYGDGSIWGMRGKRERGKEEEIYRIGKVSSVRFNPDVISQERNYRFGVMAFTKPVLFSDLQKLIHLKKLAKLQVDRLL